MGDTDVIAPVKQVTDSVKLLRDGQVDFVYPYDSRFLDTSDIIRNIYLDTGDISILETNFRRMKSMYTPNPVGGAFFCNLQSYMNSGLENEKFYGWGVEDGERFIRWKNLGCKIQRIEGILYHLTHPKGLNSCVHHPSQSIIKYRELRASHRLISEK